MTLRPIGRGQQRAVGIEEPRTHQVALGVHALAHQPFRVGEVVQPIAIPEFTQAVVTACPEFVLSAVEGRSRRVEILRRAGECLLGEDAVAVVVP